MVGGPPRRYSGAAFVCESTGNLVHVELIEPRGATFQSRPECAGIEFLASHDEWFRPVFLEHGPDGALYVVDMYRAVIEHPQWMPEELRTRRDLHDGNRHGRIYRLISSDAPPVTERIDLGAMAGEELVDLLESRNAWHRETAARLLIERPDQAPRSRIERMVARGRVAEARSRALWLLAGLRELTWNAVATGLRDDDSRVREQAVRLSEPWIVDNAAHRREVAALSADENPRVRFQVALSLGESLDNDVLPALATIALKDAEDVWTRRGVATSLADRSELLLGQLLEELALQGALSRESRQLVAEIAELAGAAGDLSCGCQILAMLGQFEQDANTIAWQSATLLGLARGFQRRGISLMDVAHDGSKMHSAARAQLHRLADEALAVAADTNVDPDIRTMAIELAGYLEQDRSRELLLQLLCDSANRPGMARSCSSLSRHENAQVASKLIELLPAQTPGLRRATLDALLTRPAWTLHLLAAIERNEVPAAEIDPARRQSLLQHREPAIGELAQKLLGSQSAGERAEVLGRYQRALELNGDAGRGRELFAKHCATCHRIADVGVDVGPDISDSRVKSPIQLLTDILDPNRAIDANYTSYTVSTSAGQIYAGLISTKHCIDHSADG